MFQSGTYVVFSLKPKAKAPTKEDLAKAFKGKKMKLEGFEKSTRKVPGKAYSFGIKPVT